MRRVRANISPAYVSPHPRNRLFRYLASSCAVELVHEKFRNHAYLSLRETYL
jgi:hypothetical protein